MKDTDVRAFDDDELEYTPRSKMPIAIALLVILAGAGGWFAWQIMTAVEPLRVLVAIDFDGQWYEGSKPAARLVDDVSDQLRSLGFEPVEGGDPAIMQTLEDAGDDLRGAARSLKAAWVVTGRVKTAVTEHPVDEGTPYLEVRATADIELFHVDDPADKTIRHQTQSWAGSKDKAWTLRRLSTGVSAEKIGAKVVPSLVNHPRIAKQLFGEGKDKKGLNAEIAGKLRKAEQYANASHSKLRTAEKAYAAFKIRRLEGEKGPVKVSYHGTMAEHDGIIGAGPKGFLVKTEDEELYVDPDNSKLRRLEALESLAWKAPEDAPKAEPIWSGYNIYSYPGVTEDGQVAALVEDLFGWAKTVTLIHADGQSKRLRVDAEKRFSSLKPSPTGKAVAFYERECKRCVDELVVLSAEGDPAKELFRVGNEGGTLHGFAWVSDSKLLVMHSPKVEPLNAPDAEPAEPPADRVFKAVDQTIWLLDLGQAKPTLDDLHIVDPDVTLSWVRVSHDRKKAVFAARNNDGPSIAVLDIAAKELVFHATPGSTSAPNFSPDGKWIAFNIWPQGGGRDEEIGIMPAGGGAVKVLTQNRYRDRYPYFSHDSTRIFFETLGKDPNFNERRNIAVIASVPVTP
jgi:hypothetical protein